MSRLRQIAQRLGKSGIGFLIALLLYFLFSATSHGLLAAIAIGVLIFFGFSLVFRGLRWLRRHALWSVRDRLLVVYALIGVLPILLLFLLAGLGAWAVMNELAIYLATSSLDRHLEAASGAVEVLRGMPVDQRQYALPEVAKGFSTALPGIAFYITDATGSHRYPPDAAPLDIPPGWKNVTGLLVYKRHFYAWSHYRDPKNEIAVLAPLSDKTIENLVPPLGSAITLLETHKLPEGGQPARAGSLSQLAGSSQNPELEFSPQVSANGRSVTRIPPPIGRLDIPVFVPTTLPHYHLDTPGQTYEGILEVVSRPSAVWTAFFSHAETIRSVLYDTLIVIAVVFLVLELIAVFVGVSLARRLTQAINQLYAGTRRVIHGDFRQRIPTRAHDQLGELSQSFNQMTENLERLLVVEKEKERLQTEIEIAREVQSQLYPKDAPPICGLKLTVRCDPARMVSGDYYDYQETSQGKLAFAIGDVAGKGISAALLMATLQAALRAQITQSKSSRESDSLPSPPIDTARLVSALNKQTVGPHLARKVRHLLLCDVR